MAADPNEKVLMVNDNVKDEDGHLVAVEVTRHEFESVWKNVTPVGWKLQPKKKEGN